MPLISLGVHVRDGAPGHDEACSSNVNPQPVRLESEASGREPPTEEFNARDNRAECQQDTDAHTGESQAGGYGTEGGTKSDGRKEVADRDPERSTEEYTLRNLGAALVPSEPPG